jgi:hypothetical protein
MARSVTTRRNDMKYKNKVLSITAKHIRKNIDISIRKTFERLTETPEASQELFETLAILHRMRKDLDDFQKANSLEFKRG